MCSIHIDTTYLFHLKPIFNSLKFYSNTQIFEYCLSSSVPLSFNTSQLATYLDSYLILQLTSSAHVKCFKIITQHICFLARTDKIIPYDCQEGREKGVTSAQDAQALSVGVANFVLISQSLVVVDISGNVVKNEDPQNWLVQDPVNPRSKIKYKHTRYKLCLSPIDDQQ